MFKRTKKEVIDTNRFVGKHTQNIYEFKALVTGEELKKLPKGPDYLSRTVRIDPLTGKKSYTTWKPVEIKSSPTARVRPSQKGAKKKIVTEW
jgi:hypothetical protein